MKRIRVGLVAAALLGLAGCGTVAGTLSQGGTSPLSAADTTVAPKYFSSIVWMVLENKGYDQVNNLQSCQYLQQNGAVLQQSFAMTHPSGPNYRFIAAGQPFSTQEVFVGQEPSVASEYDTLGIPTIDWYIKGTPDLKHDPYQELTSSTPITPRTDAFNPDLLPTHCQVYLGMDDADNAHSGPLSVADQNIMDVLQTLNQSKWFHTPDASGHYPVFMETWDESFQGDQHIFTAFYGDGVKAGYGSQTTYNHLSICRLMTDNWGLAPLGQATQAQPVTDIWK